MDLNEKYILSIANELLYLEDFIPPNINGVLALQRGLKWNHTRGIFLQKCPDVIKEMRKHRVEVISHKTSEDRKKILEEQVISFVEKYPKWNSIIQE